MIRGDIITRVREWEEWTELVGRGSGRGSPVMGYRPDTWMICLSVYLGHLGQAKVHLKRVR